jgi:hypothetical protein
MGKMGRGLCAIRSDDTSKRVFEKGYVSTSFDRNGLVLFTRNIKHIGVFAALLPHPTSSTTLFPKAEIQFFMLCFLPFPKVGINDSMFLPFRLPKSTYHSHMSLFQKYPHQF